MRIWDEKKFLLPRRRKVEDLNVAVVDIESKDGPSQRMGFTRPFMVGLLDRKGYKTFRNTKAAAHWKHEHLRDGGCIDLFFKHLLSKKGRYTSPKTVIFAHNGGRFDFLFFIEWLKRRHKSLEFSIMTSGPRIIRLLVKERYGKKREFEFRDSVAILPISLDEAAKIFCPSLPKLAFDKNAHENDKGWDAYLKRDCVALREAVEQFAGLLEGLGGSLSITLPSCAMTLFRSAFQRRPIHVNAHTRACIRKCDGRCGRKTCDRKCHGCLHAFARRSYFGGRSEILVHRARRLRAYDRNSSYPASMLQPMPTGDVQEDRGGDYEELKRKWKGRLGLVECDVEIPADCLIPPLPSRVDDRLSFPAGKLRGVWWVDELDLLFDEAVKGKITKIRRSFWFEARDDFRAMMLELYALRDKNREDYSEALSYVAKILANSFYGRFGMNPVRSEVFLPDGEVAPDFGEPISPDGDIWERETVVESTAIIPQIASYITCLSRVSLWQAMNNVVQEGGIVAYVDTDCVYTDLEFPDETYLGGWKSEFKDHLEHGNFVLPKLYRNTFHSFECDEPKCEGCYVREHGEACKNPRCSGCIMVPKSDPAKGRREHEEGCTRKSCPGCKVSRQKMKGIPRAMATSKNFDWIVHRGGELRFTRLSQFRTMVRGGIQSPEVMSCTKTSKAKYEKRIRGKGLEAWTLPIVVNQWTTSPSHTESPTN